MKCIGLDAAIHEEVRLCLSSNCTVQEALESAKYSNEKCGVSSEDRRAAVWVPGVVFGILGLVAFGLRCLAHLLNRTQLWGLDDWAICVAICCLTPLCGISVARLGLDIWAVEFENITKILHLFYWGEILYATALTFTRVAVLFFYLKVFPMRSFQLYAYILMALTFAYGIGYGAALIFQCIPIEGAWRSWNGEYHAKCININQLGWSAAAINVVLDLATIILPLPFLFRLSMSWKKKIQVIGMFAVGLFITAVSTVRLHTLVEFGKTTNVTQSYVEVGYWSIMEISVGIVCACMPATRSLLRRGSPSNTQYNMSRDSAAFGVPASQSRSLKIMSRQRSVKHESPNSGAQSDNASQVELVYFSKDPT
ncbi:hypothetical protein JX265_003169 [Neoarthrinium moseri]|uniref:Rhodopsin domain-containing protein n=1 Tax=Neoarthrinium moseri TaxID=1658444 RepID=A0A9P9WTS0_9PEZI|nr:hypothetical protein JX265_003169 [Neoarthrinium moseri]